MAFQKGNQINKGKHNSPETEFKKGQVPWIKGKKLSDDICQVCHVELNETNWSPCQIRRNRHICKKCDTEKSMEYYHAHEIEIRATNPGKCKQYYRLHKDKMKTQAREHYLKNKDSIQKYHREYGKNYRKTTRAKELNKKAQKKFRQSPKGKVKDAKSKSKRKRNLEFIKLNEWFEGAHAHHIDRRYVLYIPQDIHTSIWHSLEKADLIKKINNLVFDWAIRNNVDGTSLEIIKFVIG